MTCIVGLVDGGKVYIGGDSAGAADQLITVRADEKVFIRGAYAMGFTTSFRMGDLLRYSVVLPAPPENGTDLRGFMVTRFVDAVRAAFKEGGFATKKDEVETAGEFLVGTRGRLFIIHTDYQVSEPKCGFAAAGSGCELALGALHASPLLAAADRANIALQAAERFNCYVRRPFKIVMIDGRVEQMGRIHDALAALPPPPPADFGEKGFPPRRPGPGPDPRLSNPIRAGAPLVCLTCRGSYVVALWHRLTRGHWPIRHGIDDRCLDSIIEEDERLKRESGGAYRPPWEHGETYGGGRRPDIPPPPAPPPADHGERGRPEKGLKP